MFDDSNHQVDLFSGPATFTISPPPSSLPLPTFSLRPKLSCRAAAGIDAGATDDLRRLLRLRWKIANSVCVDKTEMEKRVWVLV
ncbi:hypothetical protein PHJA_001668800 [Phtheirospermum japonicum]|uniref:Uncharacterized protein n=1 Tax=Phtheirospermum japonicum TaxID=374723 RepID=A0A830CFV5_9LAMI|nr:hypothetical protein PHJA_001668800 [Phtheirospermum japonicum]